MSLLNGALRQTPVLVTGATGFIGGGLAHRLARVEGAVVTGAGRALDQAAWLADVNVRLLAADLRDAAAMAAAVAGQAVIFHIGGWVRAHRDASQAHAVNVTATEQLLRLAAAAGARRLVYISSINVYGPTADAVIHEARPLDTGLRDIYGRTTALADVRVRQLGRELGLETVVVRPGLVYGPRAPSWTVQIVKLMQQGWPVILGDGRGYAAPTFIENLLDGMLLAATAPGVAGSAFNLVDPPLDWRAFFGYYAAMIGRPPRRIPLPAARLLAWLSEMLPGLGLPLTRERLQFYTMHATYSMARAERLLGYQPRVDIDEGMRRTEAWLRTAGLIRGAVVGGGS